MAVIAADILLGLREKLRETEAEIPMDPCCSKFRDGNNKTYLCYL